MLGLAKYLLVPVAPVCTPSVLGQVYRLATLGLLAQYSHQVLISPVGLKCYLIAVLLFTSLITTEIECLFMYCRSFLFLSKIFVPSHPLIADRFRVFLMEFIF